MIYIVGVYMRKKNAFKNVIIAILYRILTVVSGFLISKIILTSFGSGINGFISSCKQLISYLVLLEMGITGSSTYSLYGPLYNNDIKKTNKILYLVKKSFIKTGIVFIFFSLIISVFYAFYARSNGINYFIAFSLFLILSSTTALDFLFLSKFKVLFVASQKEYIVNIANIIYTIFYIIFIVIANHFSLNIVIIESMAIVAYFIKFTYLGLEYQKKFSKEYSFSDDKNDSDVVLLQKNDVMIHEICWLVLSSFSLIVINFMYGLNDTSVYAVYYMIIGNLQALLAVFYSAVLSGFGSLLAKKMYDKFRDTYEVFEIMFSFLTNIIFICCYILIIPFIKIYTKNITDYNYINELLAITMIFKNYLNSMRIPSSVIISSSGGFLKTKKYALISVAICVILSISLGFVKMELIMIGSAIAYIFRIVTNIYYAKNNISCYNYKESIKTMIVSFLTMVIMCFTLKICVHVNVVSYFQWFVFAVIVFIIVSIINFLVLIIYSPKTLKFIKSFFTKNKDLN